MALLRNTSVRGFSVSQAVFGERQKTCTETVQVCFYYTPIQWYDSRLSMLLPFIASSALVVGFKQGELRVSSDMVRSLPGSKMDNEWVGEGGPSRVRRLSYRLTCSPKMWHSC